VKRLLFSVLALAAACGETAKVPPAPLDRFYRPTGMAMHGERLLVASSNSDLRYDFDEGGSVLAVAPNAAGSAAARLSGVRIPSFAGDLAVADAAACGLDTTLALVPVRGNDAVFALDLGADGTLSCGSGCEVPLSGPFGDPNAIVVACGGGRARAFVGYLRGVDSAAWVSAVDLEELLSVRAGNPSGAPVVESGTLGLGPVRGMAYDPLKERLWVTGVATSTPTPLRAIELGGGCSIERELRDGGCPRRTVATSALPAGLELRGIALSNAASNPPVAPGGAEARRVYLTARAYDTEVAAAAGGRTDDRGGVLVIADLVEGVAGVELRVVRTIEPVGEGAAAVAVLPARPGQRDLVAVIASDSGDVLVYDDQTGELRRFARNASTGAPLLGHAPWGLAVQPLPAGAGSAVCGGAACARIFVGSFGESFVTAIDVPLDAPMSADFAATDAKGLPISIGPQVSP
jgi:hypothetical protein